MQNYLIYSQLKTYAKKDKSFHMPGHKGRGDFKAKFPVANLDVTELSYTDDLFCAGAGRYCKDTRREKEPYIDGRLVLRRAFDDLRHFVVWYEVDSSARQSPERVERVQAFQSRTRNSSGRIPRRGVVAAAALNDSKDNFKRPYRCGHGYYFARLLRQYCPA